MIDWPDLREVEAKEIFVQLTTKAIKEETVEGFLDVLLQRLIILEVMDLERIVLGEAEVSKVLSMERAVCDRLNETRSCLMKNMDQHSMESKNRTPYRSRIPFPMIPAFLSQSA